MSEQKPVRATKANELRLSDLELSSVSAGGGGEIVPEAGTTIILTIIDEP